MIASARMYAVTPAAAALWRRLLERVAERAGHGIDVLDWPAPRPLADLWAKPDKAAVFMCGLPFSLAIPQPELVAAPVPLLPRAGSRPVYWSELVVHADSSFRQLPDTFGHRIAFTVPDSQSGYAAVLHHLMKSAHGKSLYREIIAPCITPHAALLAVAEGLAEIAAIDAWAFALMQRHLPDLAARVRVVDSTELTPIPALIASTGRGTLLADAFLAAHDDPALQDVLEALLIQRFVRPEAECYAVLKRRFETARTFWQRQPLAESSAPEFVLGPDTTGR